MAALTASAVLADARPFALRLRLRLGWPMCVLFCFRLRRRLEWPLLASTSLADARSPVLCV